MQREIKPPSLRRQSVTSSSSHESRLDATATHYHPLWYTCDAPSIPQFLPDLGSSGSSRHMRSGESHLATWYFRAVSSPDSTAQIEEFSFSAMWRGAFSSHICTHLAPLTYRYGRFGDCLLNDTSAGPTVNRNWICLLDLLMLFSSVLDRYDYSRDLLITGD
ncbi:hypothetical protein PAMP_011075 [Pampus punctatissimus]